MQAPLTWKVYLADQIGLRKLVGVLSDRSLSLRAAASLEFSKEELEARERVRLKVEQERRKEQILAGFQAGKKNHCWEITAP